MSIPIKLFSTVWDDKIIYQDWSNIDAFGRLRVSNPTAIFSAQFTYDLQPLVFETITAETGATVTHDATNRRATMTFSSTPTGGKAIMQSYQWFRYEPWKSQQIPITFTMWGGVANVKKFAEYWDGTNWYRFVLDGTTPKFEILSGTTSWNQSVSQSSWNLDSMDGTGPSLINIDFTKSQILYIDFQALYTGRVRFWFDIGWEIIYCHEFNNANIIAYPYIQTANLPIRVWMTSTGTVSTTMHFHCSAVISEWWQNNPVWYEFSQEGTVTASSGARTHLLSIRPKTTFNSIANRVWIWFLEVDMLVTGTNPILWELVLWQAISWTTTYTDVNTTYSACEYNTAGTISWSPTIVIDNWYVAASNQSRWESTMTLTSKYPISLDAAWAVRALWTISLIVTGIWGTSACRWSMKWSEIR